MWPIVEVCWDKFLVRAILRGLLVVLEEILVFTAWKELLNYDGDDVGEKRWSSVSLMESSCT